MKINKKYLEDEFWQSCFIIIENKSLRQYCVDAEDLVSFMLDYVISNMQYDFNIDIDKNKIIIEKEEL